MRNRSSPDDVAEPPWTRRVVCGIAAAALAAASVLVLAVPAAHATSCEFAGGHTDRYSWTRDEADSCTSIGTDALLYDGDTNQFVWHGFKWSSSWYVKLQPGTTVHDHDSAAIL